MQKIVKPAHTRSQALQAEIARRDSARQACAFCVGPWSDDQPRIAGVLEILNLRWQERIEPAADQQERRQGPPRGDASVDARPVLIVIGMLEPVLKETGGLNGRRRPGAEKTIERLCGWRFIVGPSRPHRPYSRALERKRASVVEHLVKIGAGFPDQHYGG